MNHKIKEKLDSILYHICMALTVLSAAPILYGVFADNTKIFFIGIGIFSVCLICAAINDPPYYYDDKGD